MTVRSKTGKEDTAPSFPVTQLTDAGNVKLKRNLRIPANPTRQLQPKGNPPRFAPFVLSGAYSREAVRTGPGPGENARQRTRV
jgi:hypothetical protein